MSQVCLTLQTAFSRDQIIIDVFISATYAQILLGILFRMYFTGQKIHSGTKNFMKLNWNFYRTHRFKWEKGLSMAPIQKLGHQDFGQIGSAAGQCRRCITTCPLRFSDLAPSLLNCFRYLKMYVFRPFFEKNYQQMDRTRESGLDKNFCLKKSFSRIDWTFRQV